MDQTVQSFADSTARASAITTPVEGMVTYLNDIDSLSVYNGTAFTTDRTIQVFAGTAARGSAIPTPAEGMVTYLEDTSSYESYDGAAWIGFGGGGKILQVIQQVKTDTTTITAATYQDISDLAVSITPSSATSKILVFTQVGAGCSGVEAGKILSLFRGSTNLFVPSSPGSRQSSGFAGAQTPNAGDIDVVSFSFIDSPNTTSSTTYSVKGLVTTVTAGNSLFINRSRTDNDNSGFSRAISTITVMEVAA
jgi:hypothetical protein